MPLLKRKPKSFNLQIQDFVLRVNAPQEFYEECEVGLDSTFAEDIARPSIATLTTRFQGKWVALPIPIAITFV